MTGWFGSKDEIPPNMIRLSALPVDNDGAPVWNDEIEQLTKRFGEDFVAPFLVDAAPGMCYGGYVAKAHYIHAVRTYSATAVLITRQNDELRTTVSITAPQSSSGGQWKPYHYVYTASLPKEHLKNIVHTIRGLCEQSHAQELIKKGQRPSSGGRDAGSRTDDSREPVLPPIAESFGFSVNEFVVYPAHGVGQILAIEKQEIGGAKVELFVINFMKEKMTLRVPTAKVANVGMRKLSEPSLVKKALETLKGRARIEHAIWAQRAQEYEAKTNSGDIVAIAEVVRDLYRSEAQPEQSYSERQLYEAALDRLSREIAVIQHVTETEAVAEIESQLAKSPRRAAAQSDPVQKADSLPASSSARRSNPMRVDFSEWYTRPGFVARKYTYSQMGDTRDTELEVHFDIQAGLSIFTFVSFIINNLDLKRETSLRGSLRPMDGSGPNVILNMMGRPDGAGNVIMGVFGRDDAGQCLRAYLDAKDMHFEVDTSDGERLIRLPLPNDGAFGTAYGKIRDQVQAADEVEFAGKDGILGRVNRFFRDLSKG